MGPDPEEQEVQVLLLGEHSAAMAGAELIEIFAKNLRDQRLRMNLTQESLADACDLHRTYIGAIERGERNISLRNLQKIADVLQIKAADLITESQK